MIGWEYLDLKQAEIAYYIGKSTKDEKLLAEAKQMILKNSSKDAYLFGERANDEHIKQCAAKKMIQENPRTAFKFACERNDEKFMGKALKAYINSMPFIDSDTKEKVEQAYFTSRFNLGQKDKQADSI